MLLSFTENLPTARVVQRTVVLGTGESNTLVDISPLTYVQTVVVKSTAPDATMRIGGLTEEAIPILSGEERSNMCIDTIHLSTTTAGTVILELQGR